MRFTNQSEAIEWAIPVVTGILNGTLMPTQDQLRLLAEADLRVPSHASIQTGHEIESFAAMINEAFRVVSTTHSEPS